MRTCVLAINLLERDRPHHAPVIREIEVCEDSSLYTLAEAIVKAYGFDFDHAFGFFGGEDKSGPKYELFADMAEDTAAEHSESGSVEHTQVAHVWKSPGDTMLFLFDYGDMWQFSVRLFGFDVAQPKSRYPRVVKKIGRAPDQYPEANEE